MPQVNSNIKYQTSKYLIDYRKSDGSYLIYHSLFGNLKKINHAAMSFLSHFEKATRFEDVVHTMEGSNIKKSFETLIENYFLVEKGFDERTLVEAVLEKRIGILGSGQLINCLQLCISDRCNINCTYCFANRADEGSLRRQELRGLDEKLMTYETACMGIDKFLKIACDKDKSRFIIKFFGREPLLNWSVIARIMAHYGRQQFGMKIQQFPQVV